MALAPRLFHSRLAQENIGKQHTLNALSTIRRKQTPWARRVLGLFAVVWLNMALQPCAMAFGDMQQRDCMHCPPGHSMEMSSTDTHMSHAGGSTENTPDNAFCETGPFQCGLLDDYKFDGRSVQVKVKNAPSDVPIGIVQAVVSTPVLNNLPAPCSRVDIAFQPGDQPPLNLLYCVYLK